MDATVPNISGVNSLASIIMESRFAAYTVYRPIILLEMALYSWLLVPLDSLWNSFLMRCSLKLSIFAIYLFKSFCAFLNVHMFDGKLASSYAKFIS